jgi:hypothetical protein
MATQTHGEWGKEMEHGSIQRKTISQFDFIPVMRRNTMALRKADLFLIAPICLDRPSFPYSITRASMTIYLQSAYITEAFSTHQEMRNTFRILFGKPEWE